MADARGPASELERRLRGALDAGDDEGYFRALASAELVLPVPSDAIDDVLADRTRPTWQTREEDGRTHVLVFTSPAAMRAGLGSAYRHFMTMRFGDIAQGWPDARWWLLVDAAQPTEGRLPGWFVTQLTTGDTRPPSAGPSMPSSAALPAPRASEESAPRPRTTVPHGSQTPTTADLPAGSPPGIPDVRTAPETRSATREPEAEVTSADSTRPASGTPEQHGATRTSPPDTTTEQPRTEPASPPTGTAEQHGADRTSSPGTTTEQPGTERTSPPDTTSERPGPHQTNSPGTPPEQPRTERTSLAGGSAEQPGAAMTSGTTGVDVPAPGNTGDPTGHRAAAPDSPAALGGPAGADAFSPEGTGGMSADTHESAGDPAASGREAQRATAGPAGVPDAANRQYAPAAPAADETSLDLPVIGAEEPAPAGAPPAGAPEAARAEFRPANEVERELQIAVARGDQDAFIRTLVDAEVLLPVPDDMDYSLRPGRSGFPWQRGEIDGTTMVPVFTSLERLREGAGAAEFLQVPFKAVIRYWPDPRWALAVNLGTPAGASLLGEQLAPLGEWADRLAAQRLAEGFEPHNEVEQRLHQAAARQDTEAFFEVLLGAQVLVPADPESPWGIRPDDPEFPWRPVPVHGKPSLQLFTSLKWMHEVIGSSRFIMPSFVDIAAAWPDAGWTLVLNPGTPIDITLPGERVSALAAASAGTRPEAGSEPADAAPGAAASAVPAPEASRAQADPYPPPRAAEPRPPRDFRPGNDIDQELYDAASAGDSDAFLRVLLSTAVLVPIPADAPTETTPLHAEFRWDAALHDDSSIHVFTSPVRLREVLPTARFVYADFRDLIGSWPRAAIGRRGERPSPARMGEPRAWAMLVNPGTRIGASLRGDQVHALSEWAVRVGIVGPRSAERAPDRPGTERPAEGTATGEPTEMDRETSAEPLAGQQPTIMQKVLPHAHVAWYLEQGYDRVGGFVHPAGDVTELKTPRQLYEALGLLTADSPFAASDEKVFVLRWPAFCSELYRIPFGGQSQAELERWGEAGWVIERPPFLGTGFASGSAGSIREFKVDSARLPYGAELYQINDDRTERYVAMYDPDRLAWLTADSSEAAGDAAETAP